MCLSDNVDNFKETLVVHCARKTKTRERVKFILGKLQPIQYFFSYMDAAQAYALGIKSIGRDVGEFLPMCGEDYNVALQRDVMQKKPLPEKQKKNPFDFMYA